MKEKHHEVSSRSKPPEPPTPLARKLVRYILGFGVGVGLGLAPYLGAFDLPFFKPLLGLIPELIQNTAIPLSSALMGIVAVVTEFYGGERLTRPMLRKLFKKTLLIAALAFIILIIVHTWIVVTVPILGGKESVSYVVGFSRPMRPPCTVDVSDAECIKYLTLDTSVIESFWGDRQIRVAKGLLILSYLSFTSAFGTIIGLIVLRDRISRKRPHRVARHLKA
jgi:uncharacterized membrane protein